ncbi:hypothetical protein DFH06DRAFT_1332290 [Mycena polygramma]|nr:hypothetical protein DFH06DRAFT_1332290 [Mycena polygramma]
MSIALWCGRRRRELPLCLPPGIPMPAVVVQSLPAARIHAVLADADALSSAPAHFERPQMSSAPHLLLPAPAYIRGLSFAVLSFVNVAPRARIRRLAASAESPPQQLRAPCTLQREHLCPPTAIASSHTNTCRSCLRRFAFFVPGIDQDEDLGLSALLLATPSTPASRLPRAPTAKPICAPASASAAPRPIVPPHYAARDAEPARARANALLHGRQPWLAAVCPSLRLRCDGQHPLHESFPFFAKLLVSSSSIRIWIQIRISFDLYYFLSPSLLPFALNRLRLISRLCLPPITMAFYLAESYNRYYPLCISYHIPSNTYP